MKKYNFRVALEKAPVQDMSTKQVNGDYDAVETKASIGAKANIEGYNAMKAKSSISPPLAVLLTCIDADIILNVFLEHTTKWSDEQNARMAAHVDGLAEKYVMSYFKAETSDMPAGRLYEILFTGERDAIDQFDEDRLKQKAGQQMVSVFKMYKLVIKYAGHSETTTVLNPYNEHDKYALALFCKRVNDAMMHDIHMQIEKTVRWKENESKEERTTRELDSGMKRMMRLDQVWPLARNFSTRIRVKLTSLNSVTEFSGLAEKSEWVFDPNELFADVKLDLFNNVTRKSFHYEGKAPRPDSNKDTNSIGPNIGHFYAMDQTMYNNYKKSLIKPS